MLLMVKNFDVDEQDGSGWTLLMIAASTGNTELVEKLIKRDAGKDVKSREHDGYHLNSPLSF